MKIRGLKRGKTESLHKLKQNGPIRLHLGCGRENFKGYINLDFIEDSAADFIVDTRDIKNYFERETVEEIILIHNISYLRYWEAADIFVDFHSILKNNGKLILEFPDIEKCAHSLLQSKNKYKQYLKSIQGIYAFDMIQIARREKFTPYAFGWSAWHIVDELKKGGFTSVVVKEPETHDQLSWRDTRIEALKLIVFSILNWNLFEFSFLF